MGVALVFTDRVFHDRRRQMLQPLPGPHRIKLHLGDAFDVVQPVVGLGHRLADRCDTVVGHHQHGLVAHHPGQPLAFRGIEGGPGVDVVVGGLHHGAEFGLSDRQDVLVLQPGECAGEGHMGVEDRGGVALQPVDRGVNAIGGALDFALAGEAGAVVADFHEAACGDLGPVQAEGNLVVAVVGARHAQGEVIENAFIEPVHHGEAMGGGEIDARLPARVRPGEVLGLQ